MRSCEKASRLASIAHDRRLTPREFVGLWIHRAICGPCRIYRKQLHTLRNAARDLNHAQTVAMDDPARERIRARLRETAANEPPESS